MRQEKSSRYYLQVVKHDEEPEWPEPEDELIIGQKSLGHGFTQYWAYPQDSGKEPADEPHAEVIASQNPTDNPAILIDEPEKSEETQIDLILVKDGHAWAKTESNIDNLDDNIASVLDFAKNKLEVEVEHFMTTDRVSAKVEKKLDELEDDNNRDEKLTAIDEHVSVNEDETSFGFGPVKTSPYQGPISSSTSSLVGPRQPGNGFINKLGLIIPILVIVAVFAGVVVFRDKIMNKLNSGQSETSKPGPTAEPTLTPTPTPISLDRSQFKLRVLNGTTQTGAAADLAEKLKKLGWQVIKVGNAANQVTAKTQVNTKKDLEASVSAVLVTDLAPDLQASTSADLKSSDKADAEVVIGKE